MNRHVLQFTHFHHRKNPLLLQQPKEEPFLFVVRDDVNGLDLVGRCTAHHLQIPVQSIGLQLDELGFQWQDGLLQDFLAVGLVCLA